MTSTDTQTWTTKRLLAWIAEAFTRKNLDSPRLQAEILVSHVLGCDRLRLYMEADRPATPIERSTLRDLVTRALADEPIDYLVGERWFFGMPFHVSPAVLVPRPCTETIVEQVLLHIRAAIGGPGFGTKTGEGTWIADVCTGSGCIALALLKHLLQATAVATDISRDALEIARKNAARHKLSDRIELLEGNLLEPLISHPAAPAAQQPTISDPALASSSSGFHYILSNPPYIPDSEWSDVPANVRDYEPHLALRGGPDGLAFLLPLVQNAPRLLRPHGLLVLETAASTAQTVLNAAQAHPLLDPSTARIVKDLDGLDRVVIASRRSSHQSPAH